MPAFYFLQNNFVSQTVTAGDSFSLDVIFDTDDDTPLPFGESFQAFVYYDSSLLTFNGFSNELNLGFPFNTTFTEQADPGNADGVAATDRRFNAQWSNLGGQFPGPSADNILLYTLDFSTVPSFDSGSTEIGTIGFIPGATPTPGMPGSITATINAVPIPFEFSATTGLLALGALFGAFWLWKKLTLKQLRS